MKTYDTVSYAKSRLDGTIISKDGYPILVSEVFGTDDNIMVLYTDIHSDKDKSLKECTLDSCDINPVKLGYVNYRKNAVYVMRPPMRIDWRQGLRVRNLITSHNEYDRNIPQNVLARTIRNEYPTFENCLEKLSSGDTSIAYHRDFSINKNSILTYKGKIDIGNVNFDNGNISINQGFDWVQEAMNESLEAA